MARVVYKYSFERTGIELPEDAKILKIDLQHGTPVIWAEVDPTSKKKEKRVFRVFGTGMAVEGTYVGTYFEGLFVWHVYELTK